MEQGGKAHRAAEQAAGAADRTNPLCARGSGAPSAGPALICKPPALASSPAPARAALKQPAGRTLAGCPVSFMCAMTSSEGTRSSRPDRTTRLYRSTAVTGGGGGAQGVRHGPRAAATAAAA